METAIRTADGGMTVREAAEALGLAEKTVRERIRTGKLDAWRIPGKFGPEWRVRVAGTDDIPKKASVPASDASEAPEGFPPRPDPATARAARGLATGEGGRMDGDAALFLLLATLFYRIERQRRCGDARLDRALGDLLAQAAEIGRLQAENARLKADLAEALRPPPAPRRPFWGRRGAR